MSQEIPSKKDFSAIIPAWNEERTIRNVIKEFKNHSLCREVIVVSDGSTDRTAQIAREEGVKLIENQKNLGKGMSMQIGVQNAVSDFIFFADADITGINSEIISKISRPVLDGECSMFIAIRGRAIYRLNKFIHFFPLLGGERIVTRELWNTVPLKFKKRFKIETALNYFSKKIKDPAHFALFTEIRQTKKEFKYGFVKGFYERVKMYAEIVWVSIELYVFRA